MNDGPRRGSNYLRFVGVLLLSGASVSAAPVLDEVSSPTQFTYAADVSAADLIDGLIPATTGWNTGNNASPLELTDGIHGAGFGEVAGDNVQGGWTTVGATATYDLGTGANGTGFDIVSIQSIADWQNVGFGNQGWTMAVQVVGGGDFVDVVTVDYQALGTGPGTTKVTVTDDAGNLASGVRFIRITANQVNGGANAGAFVWRELDVFGTATPLSSTPPMISSLSPADEAANVPTGTDLVATFDKAIVAGTGNITIKDLDTPSQTVIPVGDPQVSLDGLVLTISPDSPLTPGKNYAVQIADTAIEDSGGNNFAGILDDTTWNFATDGTAPMDTGLGPMNGAGMVSTTSDLSLLFDEDVQAGAGNITLHLASDGTVVETVEVTSGSVTINGAEVTVDIGNLLPGTTYYVKIDAGGFVDSSGNPYAGIGDATGWVFTTTTVVVAEVFDVTQFAYAGDVSSTDLLHGLTPVTDGWNLTNEASPLELTDGIHGVGFGEVPGDRVQGGWTTVGATAEYNLGTGVNGMGYDLTSIQSIADWVNVGFGNQGWTLEVKPVGGTYTVLATIDYQALGTGPGTTKVTLTDATGTLAAGVEFLRVTTNEVNGGANGGAFVWRELDVFGTETGAAGPLVLKIVRGAGGLDFEWNSLPGMQYDLVSSTDLSLPVETWPVYDEDGPGGVEGYENIPNAGSTTTLTDVQASGPARFFALVEEEIPPLLSEDFELDDGGFTVIDRSAGGIGSDWAHGDPNSDGGAGGGAVTEGNGSSTNCWGTDIGNPGTYASGTDTSLISPVIDLTAVTAATLSFAQAIDILSPDALVVNLIEADIGGDIVTVIGAPLHTADDTGTTTEADWNTISGLDLAAGLGQEVRIEWRFTGNGDGTYIGAYIDDVLVTSP